MAFLKSWSRQKFFLYSSHRNNYWTLTCWGRDRTGHSGYKRHALLMPYPKIGILTAHNLHFLVNPLWRLKFSNSLFHLSTFYTELTYTLLTISPFHNANKIRNQFSRTSIVAFSIFIDKCSQILVKLASRHSRYPQNKLPRCKEATHAWFPHWPTCSVIISRGISRDSTPAGMDSERERE